YFIRVEEFHKIGSSREPDERLVQVTTHSPYPASLTHQIATDRPRWLESGLHRFFRDRHVRGEWFRLTAEDLALVLSIERCFDTNNLPPALVAALHSSGRRRAPKVPAFAVAVRTARLAREWTIDRLAAEVGASAGTIGNVESGRSDPMLTLA